MGTLPLWIFEMSRFNVGLNVNTDNISHPFLILFRLTRVIPKTILSPKLTLNVFDRVHVPLFLSSFLWRKTHSTIWQRHLICDFNQNVHDLWIVVLLGSVVCCLSPTSQFLALMTVKEFRNDNGTDNWPKDTHAPLSLFLKTISDVSSYEDNICEILTSCAASSLPLVRAFFGGKLVLCFPRPHQNKIETTTKTRKQSRTRHTPDITSFEK